MKCVTSDKLATSSVLHFFCQFSILFCFIKGAEFSIETTIAQLERNGPLNAEVLIYCLSHNNFITFILHFLKEIFDECKKADEVLKWQN